MCRAGATLDWLQLPCPAPLELKSLFVPGPKLDIAIKALCLLLSGLPQGLGELRGHPGLGTDGEGKQESCKEGTPEEGLRAAIPQLFAPLAVAISFLPAPLGWHLPVPVPF